MLQNGEVPGNTLSLWPPARGLGDHWPFSGTRNQLHLCGPFPSRLPMTGGAYPRRRCAQFPMLSTVSPGSRASLKESQRKGGRQFGSWQATPSLPAPLQLARINVYDTYHFLTASKLSTPLPDGSEFTHGKDTCFSG